ncbi:hypothetical protein MTO96_040703 [Rhipicephalus appendiculatus]
MHVSSFFHLQVEEELQKRLSQVSRCVAWTGPLQLTVNSTVNGYWREVVQSTQAARKPQIGQRSHALWDHSCLHWHGGRAARQHLRQETELSPKGGDDAGLLFDTAGMILTEALVFFE